MGLEGNMWYWRNCWRELEELLGEIVGRDCWEELEGGIVREELLGRSWRDELDGGRNCWEELEGGIGGEELLGGIVGGSWRNCWEELLEGYEKYVK